MKSSLVLFSALTLLLAGAAISCSEEKKEAVKADAKALFENKCNQCHSSDRPKALKKTSDEWKATVLRMKNSNGCPITDDEAKLIIDYLSKAYGKE
mgnify:CR=1 FL=1